MDKEDRKNLKKQIERCLDLVLEKKFPLQLAIEYVFTNDSAFINDENKNSGSGRKSYSYIDMINLNFEFKTDLRQFCLFSEKQKEWYFVFLNMLSPGYYSKPKYSFFTVRVKEQGILPDLEEMLKIKFPKLDHIDGEICRQYIPVFQKLRKIIRRYCLEEYKGYSISSRSSTSVYDLFNGLYYYFFWEERLDPETITMSPVKTFYSRFPDSRVAASTFYRLKNRVLPRILLELEQELEGKELDYFNILLLLSDIIDIHKEGSNTLYRVQYFLKSCPFSLEKLSDFIQK